MNKDFSFQKYRLLLETAISKGYKCVGVTEFKTETDPKVLILRHDVDRKPSRSYIMAEIESNMLCKATYYFRTKPVSFDEKCINNISSLGHEIGYHYENLCDSKGDIDIAYQSFRNDITRFKNIGYPVKSIAMHGRPTSPYDSKEIWESHDYRDLGISSETFFDFDYNDIFYLTDAGRSWGKQSVNRRDKVETSYQIHIDSLDSLIKAFENETLPDKIMINIHPEHWASNTFDWYKIYYKRLIRNFVKMIYLRFKKL